MGLRTGILNKALFVSMGVALCIAAHAAEYTFTGASGGAFGTAANWSGSTLPANGDTAIIPAGTRVVVSTTADANALKAVSYLKLDGADASVEVLNLTVDFNASKPQLLGIGQFRARASNSTKYTISLRQDNSAFAGSFFISNILVNVYSPEAIGGQAGGNACPIEFLKTSNADFNYIGAGEYYNPVSCNAGGTWYGLGVSSSMTGAITNYGALTFCDTVKPTQASRIAHSGNYDFVQRGTIRSSVQFDAGDNTANSGSLVLDCALVFTAADKYLFMDSPGTAVLGPNFTIDNSSSITVNASYRRTDPTLRFDAADLLKDFTGTYLNIGKANGSANCNIVDINGYDQTFQKRLQTSGSAINTNILTSMSAPATFKLTGTFYNDSCNLDLGGHLTFEYAPAANGTATIVNLDGRSSDTDGGLKVTRGTLKGVAGWRMPNVRLLQVGASGSDAAAKLWISSSDVALNPKAVLSVQGNGTLQIDSGVTLRVALAKVGDDNLDGDTYQADGSLAWLVGGGTLVVSSGGVKAGDFTWNGASGAAWSDPGSWLVDGVPTARAPGAGDSVAILGNVDVIAGDGDAAVLGAIGTLKLIGADSSVTITNNTTALDISANLEGNGTLRARDVGYVGNTAKPKVGLALSGDNRGFAGDFWFTNTQVTVENVYALGTVNTVTFWGFINASNPYSQAHLPWLVWKVPGEYHNPLFLYGGGMGTVKVECNGGVTNWGHVTYWNAGGAVVRACAGNYDASYTGELAFGGGFSNIHPHTKLVANTRIDLNGACAVIGDTPIDMGWASKAFTDNGTIRWEAPIISMLDMSFLSKLILCASNVDVNASLQYNWTATAGKTIRQKCDLNGYDQHFGKMAVANNYRLEANHYHSVTSATPATLTLKKQDINQVQAFTVDGAASLVMDTADKTLTLSNVVGQASSTTGGIYAAAGTLALRDRASFANVSEIGAGKRGSDTAATLSVLTSDVQIGPGSVRSNRVVAKLDGVGKVNLPANYMLTVYQCLTNGVYLSPGSYTSSNLPSRVSGSGTLHVMRGEHKPHTMIIFR